MTTTSLESKANVPVSMPAPIKTLIMSGLEKVGIPLVGIMMFLLLWSTAAQNIDTSLGKFPGPSAVAEQAGALYDEHNAERKKEEAFYERQEKRNAKRVAEDPSYKPKTRAYTGKETFLDQIFTSFQSSRPKSSLKQT